MTLFRSAGVGLLPALLLRGTFLLIASGLCASSLANAEVRYTGIRVSDPGLTGNNIRYGNTSRNLAVGADGTIYALFHGANGVRVAQSADGGASFSPSVQVYSSDVEAEIAVASTGIVYVVWAVGPEIHVSRSLDGAKTFSSPVVMTPGGFPTTVHMATDANMVYLVPRGGQYVLVSDDNGQTFSKTSLGAGYAFSDVHVDARNGDVIVQVDDPNLYYYTSSDHGTGFSSPITPSPAGSVFYSVGAVSSGPDGRYLFVSGSGTSAVRIDLETGSLVSLTFGSNTVSQGRSLAADSFGNVVDGYMNASTMYYHISNDLGQTFQAPTKVADGTDGHANVFINPTNGDVLALYSKSGEVFLNTYANELAGYNPRLSTGTLVFSAQLLATESPAQIVTITNSDDTPFDITAIQTTGDFAAEEGCPVTLDPGASCDVSVTFTPSGAGPRNGELQISTSLGGMPRTVNLTGEGVETAPVPSFEPRNVDFGERNIGGEYQQSTTLQNDGTADLTLSGFSMSGTGFTYSENCPDTLSPAASCEILFSFSPGNPETHSATLTLNSNAPGAPASVALSGTGVEQAEFLVTTLLVGGGSILPASALVPEGETASFTAMPDDGQYLDSITGCGGTLAGDVYETGPVTVACEIRAVFKTNTYTISASAGTGGSVSPATQTVSHGEVATITVAAEEGYGIAEISGCGGALEGSEYATAPITESCSVSAVFDDLAPEFTPNELELVEADATGLQTPLPDTLVRPIAVDWQGNELEVTLVGDVTHLPPGAHTLTWRAVDERGVASTLEQAVHIWPIVSLSRDLTLGFQAGNYGAFHISLNGPAPVYPFDVSYRVDNLVPGHDLTSGTATLQEGMLDMPIYFSITQTALAGSPDQSMMVSLKEGVNLSADSTLKITLTGVNAAPTVSIARRQGGEIRAVFERSGGAITLIPEIVDPNTYDTHTVEWVSPNGASTTVENGILALQAASLPIGVHRFEVRVTDSGAPAQYANGIIDVALVDSAPALPKGVERWASNGLPDHPDYDPASPNVLPERAGQLDSYLLETDAGLTFELGAYARLSGQSQAEVVAGANTTITEDGISNVGGYFDFVVRDLPAIGQSINVVIPQRAAIPAGPVYRKYDPVQNRWFTFAENSTDSLASAPGEPGVCPPPAATVWRPGLNTGDWCVRLTIQDGGPNDADGEPNGAVADPGGVGTLNGGQDTWPPANAGSSGGGSFGLPMFALFLLVGAGRRFRSARPTAH